jgi:glycosyltransferase involved in cell wall biosynthesis
MIQSGQKVLIACDSSKSLIDFRGKLIEEMAKKHHVSVFTPRILSQADRDYLTALNVVVYENHLQGSHVSVLSDIRYFFQILNLIRKIKPDVFFPYTFKPIIYGTPIARLFRVKVITPMLTGLGYSFSEGSKNTLVGEITRKMLKVSLTNSKRLRVIFQNKDDRQTLLNLKVITNKHRTSIVNGSGVCLTHYTYTEPDLKNISFIMIARLINAKGIYQYYKAAKKIRANCPQINFKLIGAYDKNIDAISTSLYKKIKYGKVIEYLGEVNDVRPYIKDASVVVLPSYYGEGIPRCLLESMAMGRAIITCNSVGCKETVESGELINGFVVPIKNAQELAAKMEYYIKNEESIRTHGLNGLCVAKQKFDVHLVNSEMLNIMELA